MSLITNIPAELVAELGDAVRVHAGGRHCSLVGAYGEAQSGDLVALIGSSDRLEISTVNGSARNTLGVHAGTPVTVMRAT